MKYLETSMTNRTEVPIGCLHNNTLSYKQSLTEEMWKRRKSNADGDAPAKKFQKKSYASESTDNDDDSIVVCEVSTILFTLLVLIYTVLYLSMYISVCVYILRFAYLSW